MDSEINQMMNQLWPNEHLIKDESVYRIVSNLNSSIQSKESQLKMG